MDDLKHSYLTVTMDVLNGGFNFCCWMSPMRLWLDEIRSYPNGYTVEVGEYIFHVHCNNELTNKVLAGITEQAEQILMEQRAINASRKIANR